MRCFIQCISAFWFLKVIFNVLTNFIPFISFKIIFRYFSIHLLVLFSCFNGPFLFLIPTSQYFTAFFRALSSLVILVLGAAIGFTVLGIGIGLSLNSIGACVLFILSNQLLHTFSWFRYWLTFLRCLLRIFFSIANQLAAVLIIY